MHRNDDSSTHAGALREADTPEARDWHMAHRLSALQDTVDVLRAGANTLAIDNALLRIENERLREIARGCCRE